MESLGQTTSFSYPLMSEGLSHVPFASVVNTAPVDEPNAIGSSSMAGRVVQIDAASSQHQALLQRQGETILLEAQARIVRTHQNLASFKNIDEAIDPSCRIVLSDGNDVMVQQPLPSRAMTDAEKEAHRRASNFFFQTCTDYYGETILNDLYPPAERATLIQEGRPLEVGKVRDFLRKADDVVDDVREFLARLPQEMRDLPQQDNAVEASENSAPTSERARRSAAESVALAHHATSEAAAARAAYEQLGPPAQHVVEALGRALMAPVGIGLPLAIAAALPVVPGFPHLAEMAIALIPSFVFPANIAHSQLIRRLTPEQVVAHAPETAQLVFLGSGVLGGVVGFVTGPLAGMALFTHGAPLITLGALPAMGVLLGSLVVCPIIAASYFAVMGGAPTMAAHAPFFPVSDSLTRYSASQEAEQHALETEARAAAAYNRALNDIRPFVNQDPSLNANEILPAAPRPLEVRRVPEPRLAGRFI